MIAMLMPGPMGMLIILFIALLVFGNRLPEVMRSLGSSVNEFKKGINDVSQPAAEVAPAPVVAAAAPAPQPAPVAVNKQMP